MVPGIRFSPFRFTLLALPALAQAYLFLWIRRGILSSRRSGSPSGAVRLAALAMGLLLAMNACMLFMPVPWTDPPWVWRTIFFYLPAVWAIGSVFSAFVLGLVHLAHALARGIVRLFSATSSPPMDPGRRQFLTAGIVGFAAAPFLLSAYGATHGSKACEVSEVSVPFGRSMRVVQLSDIHAGVYMTRREIRRYVDQAEALHPDLLVLTGDFISNSMAFLPECLEETARVAARYGTFAVLGNHERWYGTNRELQTTFRRIGIPLLVNSHRVIRTEQGLFAVAGIDDLRNGHADLEKALGGLKPVVPVLLLSHRPEIFPQAAAHGIPLTLAGHWHGGQIKLGLAGMGISLAHLRTPYPEGLFRINASRLYVSRGIGTTFTPVRLNVPPEVTLLHLT